MQLWRALRWPALHWDTTETSWPIAHARVAREHLVARAGRLHPRERAQLQLEAWTSEAIATARLDGEALSVNPVRSSVAGRLGIKGVMRAPRVPRVESTVDLLQRALQHIGPVGADTLQHWWPRTPPRVRGEPPHAEEELRLLLAWLNVHGRRSDIDAVARAAIVHLWFETIRPFERGNGRIARALSERVLLHDAKLAARYVSFSAQWLRVEDAYHARLRDVIDGGDLDVTRWVAWYAQQVALAFDSAAQAIGRSGALPAAPAHGPRSHLLRSSQRKVIDQLHAACVEGAARSDAAACETSTEQYVRLTGVSRATAWRELSMLVERGVLMRSGRGRGTRYRLPKPP